MIALAEQVCRGAAAIIGLPAELKPDNPSAVLNPAPRVFIDMGEASLTRKGRLFALLKGEPGYQRQRMLVYERKLMVRVIIKEVNETALEKSLDGFLLALPRHLADEHNNLVKIQAERVEHGGYNPRLVEVFSRLEATLHLTFSGVLTRDKDVGMIDRVDIIPSIKRD